MSIRLIFAGSGSFSLPVFKALTESSHHIVAVLTQPDSRAGRGRQTLEQPIALQAAELNIPVHKPHNINDPESLAQLRNYQADLMITASYGQFFGSKLLELFPHGCWNLHPSALPAYRGAAPVNATLRDGCTTTAVSLFRMVKGMDAGPLAGQQTVDIQPDDTAVSLLKTCAVAAGALTVNLLSSLIDSPALTEQDHDKATFAGKLTKQSGHIDWSQSVDHIVNLVRSVQPWPGAWTLWQERQLNLTGVRPIEGPWPEELPGTIVAVERDCLAVACGSGFVTADQWQLQGKKQLATRDFLNGTRLSVGDRFGS